MVSFPYTFLLVCNDASDFLSTGLYLYHLTLLNLLINSNSSSGGSLGGGQFLKIYFGVFKIFIFHYIVYISMHHVRVLNNTI